MLISHKYKFIFIHNPKSGGTSISKALTPYASLACRIPEKYRNYLIKLVGENPNQGIIRKHISAFKLQQIISPQIWNSYFKFGFVRNPYDRSISYFHYIKQSPLHPEYQKYLQFQDFEDYIKNHKPNIYRLQSTYLTDENDNFLVDYIGRFENLQSDFDFICNKIGINRIELPHANQSKRDNNILKYYTTEMQEIVFHHFQRDFINFQYDFQIDLTQKNI